VIVSYTQRRTRDLITRTRTSDYILLCDKSRVQFLKYRILDNDDNSIAYKLIAYITRASLWMSN